MNTEFNIIIHIIHVSLWVLYGQALILFFFCKPTQIILSSYDRYKTLANIVNVNKWRSLTTHLHESFTTLLTYGGKI